LYHYIVPEFTQLFYDFDAKFPPVVAAANRLMHSITVTHIRFVFLLCLFAIALKFARRLSGEQRIRFHRVFAPALAPLPLVGEIVAKGYLASVCAILERLAAANVPLNEALQDCAALDVPNGLRRALQRVAARVEQGQAFGDAMRSEKALPHSSVSMLTLGEASGRLEDAARQLRLMYEQQVMSNIRMTLDIAGPIGVLGLGVIALALYGGIFAMLISISDLMVNSI
jgi:type II secretory pathway component PulF